MKRISLCIFPLIITSIYLHAQTAVDIVKKANDLLHGLHTYSEISMTIVKPGWSRTVTMKSWALEPDYALVYIESPASDKGNVTLKRKNEVWNWLPSIQRVIKIPPSMMLQSWMGSDFTNDDLVRESSIIEDYTHTLVGSEKFGGVECWKIQLIPKPEAGVVWGKLLLWISKDRYLEMKTEYYDEDSALVKSFIGSDVKDFDGRYLPSHWEMIPVDKPGEKTILDYLSMNFSIHLNPDFFSEENMKRVH
jgi:outer membrane lipoprotein-sorting protein